LVSFQIYVRISESFFSWLTFSFFQSLPEFVAQQAQSATSDRHKQSDSSRIFDAFDVKETSYHLVCEKINLHFCDDPGGNYFTNFNI
jgi:hypothetical protein